MVVSCDGIGEIVNAEVEAIAKDRVILKLNDKHGFIKLDELGSTPDLGEKLEVFVEGEAVNGMLVCSVLKVGLVKTQQALKEAFEQQKKLELTVVAVEENGLVCDVMGVYGFMPKRQIEVSNVNGALEKYIGQTLVSQIIKLSSDGTVIVSHRSAIEKDVLEAREKVTASLAVGNTYEATITQIVSYGVFADLGAGVEGLVHRTNLSWSNAEPSEIAAIGDKLSVKVIGLEEGRISLDHKSLVEDDWAKAMDQFKIGDTAEGHVTSITNFGAFVSIAKGIEGLVHNSELSWDAAVKGAHQAVKLGDTVKVKVIGVDQERRRLSLSMKRVDANPWQRAVETYKPGTRVTLPICSIVDFGLFVDMGDGLNGLIHQNDISYQGGTDFKSKYKLGDNVECVALSIDAEQCRAAFGIKQLNADPWAAFADSKPVGKQFDVEVKRIAKFGAFVEVQPGVEGLVHISELAPRRVTQVTDVVQIGDHVRATVVNMDAAKRRLGLSLTAQPFTPEADASAKASETLNESSNATLADILPSALRK